MQTEIKPARLAVAIGEDQSSRSVVRCTEFKRFRKDPFLSLDIPDLIGVRLGTPKAITAMAHKLARILWHLLKFKQPFNPDVFHHEEQKMRRKKLARLQNSAAALGYRLVESQ